MHKPVQVVTMAWVVLAAVVGRVDAAPCVGLGNVAGTTTFQGPAAAQDYAFDMAVDPAGNVVVVGRQDGLTGGTNWLVRRYDPTLTTLLSSTDYDGPGGGSDEALGVAVDSGGNVVVVGKELGTTGGANWRVRKYNPTFTVLFGSTSFNGPGNAADEATDVAFDWQANIIVVGYESQVTAGSDWRIRKYNPTLALLLATTSYSSPGLAGDIATEVVADASGTIWVAGSVNLSGSGANWTIRKYDTILTTLFCATDYNGPANGSDYVNGLALDSAGNVVAAGYEAGLTGGQNWRVRKYDATLATLLATTDYDGALASADVAYGMTVDAANNVIVAGLEGVPPDGNWRVNMYNPTLSAILSTVTHDGAGANWDEAYAVRTFGSSTVLVAGYEHAGNGTDDMMVRRYVCAATADASTEPEGPTADAGKLFAFPNPVTGDTATIAVGLTSDATEVEVTLFNISMAKVYGETFKGVAANPGHVNLGGLRKVAPGVYLMRVTAKLADGTTTTFPIRKLVIKR